MSKEKVVLGVSREKINKGLGTVYKHYSAREDKLHNFMVPIALSCVIILNKKVNINAM